PAVTLGQLLTRCPVVLEAVVRPRPGQRRAPRLERAGVNKRRCLAHAVARGDVDNVAVAVPGELGGGGRMVPAKVEAADLRPVPRDGNSIDGDALLTYRKDAPGAQRRHAVEPRRALVRRIARCNRVALLGRIPSGELKP